MQHDLDYDSIAEGIGAKRKGKVRSSGGYFGAMQLAAEVAQRFRVPNGGGRATDPHWTERRLVPLSPETLNRLEGLAKSLHIAPLQVAALLLERTVNDIGETDVPELRRAVASTK